MNDDRNEREFEKIGLEKSGDHYKLRIDYSGFGKRVDIAQNALEEQIWDDVRRYMPHRQGGAGGLIGMTNALNAVVSRRVYMYPPNHDYGHYQYEGVKYIDPVYHFAGFKTKDGWKSRKGVQKIPSGQPLKYTDPSAHAHWGEYAFDRHHLEWLDLVKRTLGI